MNEERYDVKEELKKDLWLLIVIIAALLSAVVIYNYLPNRIPMHWNDEGQIDGYGGRGSIFLFPLLGLGIYAGMLFSPLIDPRRANYAKFRGPYRVIRAILAIFSIVAYAVVAAASLGYVVKMDFIMPLGISLMFIVMGNYMGKIRHNYFLGIKTPWTLASEDVWIKTHRLGGRLWVIAGIIGAIGAFIGGKWAFAFALIPIIAASIISVVYSYILYARSQIS